MADTKSPSFRLIDREAATRVERPESLAKPWVWPEPVWVMISDTYQFHRFTADSYKGDPFIHAVAVNMLNSLYEAGYAVVKLDPDEGSR